MRVTTRSRGMKQHAAPRIWLISSVRGARDLSSKACQLPTLGTKYQTASRLVSRQDGGPAFERSGHDRAMALRQRLRRTSRRR
jgi:hypothetical protein